MSQDELEKLIDRIGLLRVMTMLAEICDAKSDHITSNWQDYPLAKIWETAGMRIRTCAGTKAIRFVSRKA